MRQGKVLKYLNDVFGIINGGHIGDPKNTVAVEKTLVVSLSVVGIIFSAVSVITDFIWNFSFYMKILVWISLAAYVLIFVQAKRGRNITLSKWLVIGFTIVLINLSWYYNYRADGPVIYLIFLLYAYIIFVLGNKQLVFATILIGVNVAVMYFLEFSNFLPQTNYPSSFLQSVDTYLAVVFYLIISFGLMKVVKNNYLNEYYKAIESDRLKTSFLANISHEIRTPLNAIVGFSNLMLTEDVTTDERVQYKSIINQNNKFLLELVNDILDISMIESNNAQIEEKQTNLGLVMSELEKAYTEILKTLKKENVELIKSIPEHNVTLTIDGNYLIRALRHLLDNAVKFTKVGQIQFGFAVEGKFIKFFVKDTGIGIKEEDKKSLFSRFNKFEYSKERVYVGTGIGLYLVKLIAEMFGGNVTAESTFGEGSTFIFEIPAREMKVIK